MFIENWVSSISLESTAASKENFSGITAASLENFSTKRYTSCETLVRLLNSYRRFGGRVMLSKIFSSLDHRKIFWQRSTRFLYLHTTSYFFAENRRFIHIEVDNYWIKSLFATKLWFFWLLIVDFRPSLGLLLTIQNGGHWLDIDMEPPKSKNSHTGRWDKKTHKFFFP